MTRTVLAPTFIVILLFIAVIGEQSITRADPYLVPKPPQLPSVYIRSDGSVTPSLPIQKVGDIYTFTGNIFNLTLVVQRSNIIIDGAGHTLQGNASGQGIHVEASNVTIRNLEINKFASAVIIFKASNNTITRNRITSNGIGIDLNKAKYNIVEGNTISSNNDLGILIYDDSDYNQIIGNNITSNGDAGIWCEGTTPTSDFISVIGNNISDHEKWGVLLRASYGCTVVGNDISKNNCGIELYGDNSHDCIIAENRIAFNEEGITLRSQYISEIYHNNFLNNSRHLYESKSMPTHIWNNDRQGNYWSDYNGTDANGDGIGDVPYILNSDNVDSYPLMYPYDIEKGAITLPTPEPQPRGLPSFLSFVAVASGASVVIVGIGLLFYFKKRKQ